MPIYAAVCRIVRCLQQYSLPRQRGLTGGREITRVGWPIWRTQNVAGAHTGETRRDFLILTARRVGAVGVAATIWPFIDSLNPARDTLALSTTEVDLAPVQVGQRLTVAWRGKPVFIDHRTPEEIKAAKTSNVADLRDPQPDSARVKKAGVAGRGRRVHASRLHPARPEGRRRPRPLRRLVLPVPRLGLRHLGRGSGKGPAPLNLIDAALRIHHRHRRSRSARTASWPEPSLTAQRQPDHPLDRLSAAVCRDAAARAVRISDAAQSQLLVEFRLARRDHAGGDDRHRHCSGDAIHAARRSRLRLGRAHHARRQLWLADALHPYERRVDVLS